jgi:hypothetical protein
VGPQGGLVSNRDGSETTAGSMRSGSRIKDQTIKRKTAKATQSTVLGPLQLRKQLVERFHLGHVVLYGPG